MSDIMPEVNDTLISKVAVANNLTADIKVDPKSIDQKTGLTPAEQKIIDDCDVLTEKYQKTLQSKLRPLSDKRKVAVYSVTYVSDLDTPPNFYIARHSMQGNSGTLSQILFLTITSFAHEIRLNVQELLELFLQIIKTAK